MIPKKPASVKGKHQNCGAAHPCCHFDRLDFQDKRRNPLDYNYKLKISKKTSNNTITNFISVAPPSCHSRHSTLRPEPHRSDSKSEGGNPYS